MTLDSAGVRSGSVGELSGLVGVLSDPSSPSQSQNHPLGVSSYKDEVLNLAYILGYVFVTQLTFLTRRFEDLVDNLCNRVFASLLPLWSEFKLLIVKLSHQFASGEFSNLVFPQTAGLRRDE